MKKQRKKRHSAPYLEDGFTKINNEMLEKMFENLDPYEFLVAMRIYRQTTGFGWIDAQTPKREEFSMSQSQILHGKNKQNGDVMFHGVNMGRTKLKEVLFALEMKHIITIEEGDYSTGGRAFNVYTFNVIHEQWR